MRKHTILAMMGLMALGLIAQPALAGKTSGTAITGTIDLVNATRVASTDTAWPRYGDVVGFQTSVTGRLAAKSTVYVNVVCLQGTTVVYQASAPQGESFSLADQAGQGLEWDGTAADCIGSLVYRVDTGKTATITYLAQDAFSVSV
jgi:hypothetical protein